LLCGEEHQVVYNQNKDILSKVKPHNQEAEEAVLGGLLHQPTISDIIFDQLSAVDFYQNKNRILYGAIVSLVEDNTPVDLITVIEELKRRDCLDQIGGASYVSDLFEKFISNAYIGEHAKIVREKAIVRNLIDAALLTLNRCYESGEPVEELLNQAEQVILSCGERQKKNGTAVSFHEAAQEATTLIHKLYENKQDVTGIASGFIDLDKMTSGFQNGDLIVIAARPSMGKSSLAMNIVQACGARGVPTLVFSLEMSRAQLVMRVISSIATIDSAKLRNGKLEDRDLGKVASAVGTIGNYPIFIDETSGQNIIELRAKARRMKREHDIKLMVIDYLQLMRGAEHHDNRNLEVGDITRRLKLLARELNVPIILLSQLNRQLENRGEKRPMMSDLRDSGSIEADSDLICFLYREHVYAPTTENEYNAEILVSKQRNGPIGTVHLRWNPQLTRFENLIRDFSYDERQYA
jgi:replicative DNA helicase